MTSQSFVSLSLIKTIPVCSQVTIVSATDADEGQNSQFTFKIESGDVDNVFILDGMSFVQ